MILDKTQVTINARKFDGKIHRSWKADLIEQTDSLLVFYGVFSEEVKHPDLGVIRRGTISYEYYWLDRCYNVFRFHEPQGEFRNFYCNINLPPTFENDVLDYIDLDIDILIWEDFSYQILDKIEFEENAVKYNYSPEIINKVHSNVKELKRILELRQFPFVENAII
jgi:protein associated with RNAse G/E